MPFFKDITPQGNQRQVCNLPGTSGVEVLDVKVNGRDAKWHIPANIKIKERIKEALANTPEGQVPSVKF